MKKVKERWRKIDYPGKRFLLLCLGLSIMAFGVAFSIKAALGTSPSSSAPYVTSLISGLSVGDTTILINFALILLQIAILRRRFDLLQLLQFPATIIFGIMIDVAGYAIQGIPFSNYFHQWLLCGTGIFLVALGISVEVAADFVTTAGEGAVLAICRVVPMKFSNMKILFDVTMVCLSLLLSVIFLGRPAGVREGTVAAAVCVGLITKQTNKLIHRVRGVLLK